MERETASGNEASDLNTEAQRAYTTSGEGRGWRLDRDYIPEPSKCSNCLGDSPATRRSNRPLIAKQIRPTSKQKP
jgi:hypothetical protein